MKNPSKLPVAPAPQFGVQVSVSSDRFGAPGMELPVLAEKYWSR